MNRFRWYRYAAAPATLLLVAFAARAAPVDNFFAALDTAAVVATCQIEQVEQPPTVRLAIVRARAGEVLKGSVPAATVVSVLQELKFPSDVPSVVKGAAGLCVLLSMPDYSAYRAVLMAGPYYRFADAATPVMDASVASVAKQWLALPPLSSSARVQLLLDHVGDVWLGKGALAALATTEELGVVLDRLGYARIGTLLGDRRIPLERRRQLLALLAERHLSAALPMLQSVQDADLTPFLHQTIAALGGSVAMVQLYAGLNTATADQRLAAVDALANIAARSQDETTRHDAMTALTKVAEQDGSSAVRLAAVEHLGHMGDQALPAIEPLLAQHDTRVAYAAGRALGSIGSPAATRALAQQFQQGTYDAQVAAVFGLREIATPEAMRVLADVKASPPDPRLPRVIDFATGKEPSHK